MTPNTYPKSELTLSAGPELCLDNACRPDEFPPYEPVPKAHISVLIGSPLSKAETTFIGHTIAWIAFGLAIANVFAHLLR